MKVIVLLILLTVALLPVGGLLFWQNVGNPIPAFIPSFVNTAQVIEDHRLNELKGGESVGFPFQVYPGFQLRVFAKKLPGVSNLALSPNGTLLASLPSQGKVVALLDDNHNGEAEQVKDVLTNLNHPTGIAFNKGKLFVVENSQVTRFHFDNSNYTANFDQTIIQLPLNSRSHELVFNSADQLFIGVGSDCNVCVKQDQRLASVLVSDADGAQLSVYASGLRNPSGIAFDPLNNQLWVSENGRDFLGDNLPPDEIIALEPNRDYGWPYCFGDKTPDLAFDPTSTSRCEQTALPAGKLPAHSAPRGVAVIRNIEYPSDWQGDLIVALHGSWNRTQPVGYKLVHLKVVGNRIVGMEDFISGWLDEWQAIGRPNDVIFDPNGNLYVSDDKANLVYIINKK